MKKYGIIIIALALMVSALALYSIDWVGAKSTSCGLMAIAFLLLGGVYCHDKPRSLFVKHGHVLIVTATLLSIHACFAYSTPLAMVEFAFGGFLVGGCFVSKWLWEMEDITL